MVPVLGFVAWALTSVLGLGAAAATFRAHLRRERQASRPRGRDQRRGDRRTAGGGARGDGGTGCGGYARNPRTSRRLSRPSNCPRRHRRSRTDSPAIRGPRFSTVSRRSCSTACSSGSPTGSSTAGTTGCSSSCCSGTTSASGSGRARPWEASSSTCASPAPTATAPAAGGRRGPRAVGDLLAGGARHRVPVDAPGSGEPDVARQDRRHAGRQGAARRPPALISARRRSVRTRGRRLATRRTRRRAPSCPCRYRRRGRAWSAGRR